MITENSLYDIFLRHLFIKKIYERPHCNAEWGFYAAACAAQWVFKNCIFYPAEY